MLLTTLNVSFPNQHGCLAHIAFLIPCRFDNNSSRISISPWLNSNLDLPVDCEQFNLIWYFVDTHLQIYNSVKCSLLKSFISCINVVFWGFKAWFQSLNLYIVCVGVNFKSSAVLVISCIINWSWCHQAHPFLLLVWHLSSFLKRLLSPNVIYSSGSCSSCFLYSCFCDPPHLFCCLLVCCITFLVHTCNCLSVFSCSYVSSFQISIAAVSSWIDGILFVTGMG